MSLLNINNPSGIDKTTAKKAEETVERTDPTKGEFSPSSVGYASCPRKFYFEKVVGLRSTGISLPLLFGIAMHEGVEYFYKNKGSEGMSYEQVQAQAIREFVRSWGSFKVLGDNKRNLEVGIKLLRGYCDLYRHEDVMFEATDVEGAQWIAMPNGTMLLCKLDRMVKSGEHNVVVDTKTTSGWLNGYYFKGFENHLSTSLYYYTTEQILGSCSYVLIDAIHTPVLGPTSTTAQYARRTFLRTDGQIEEALNTYSRVTNFLMEGMQKSGRDRLDHYYCNQNDCGAYGGCPYLEICKHGILHPCVDTSFKFSSEENKEKCLGDMS